MASVRYWKDRLKATFFSVSVNRNSAARARAAERKNGSLFTLDIALEMRQNAFIVAEAFLDKLITSEKMERRATKKILNAVTVGGANKVKRRF